MWAPQVAQVPGVLVQDDHLDQPEGNDSKAVRPVKKAANAPHGQREQPRPDLAEDGSDGSSESPDDDTGEDVEEEEGEGRAHGAFRRTGSEGREDTALLDALQVPAYASCQQLRFLSAGQLPGSRAASW